MQFHRIYELIFTAKYRLYLEVMWEWHQPFEWI